MRLLLFRISSVALLVVVNAGLGWSLPFNDDMVDSQLKTGQVMRPAPTDSVALGSRHSYFPPKPEMVDIKNPVPSTPTSLARGKRLFQVNCQACHGEISNKNFKASAISKFMPSMNLAVDPYLKKTDGEIAGTIRYGGLALMPRVGWKISQVEAWDIVNYIRAKQDE